MISTYLQKKKTRNTGKETDEKDRERKNNRKISIQKILEVKESVWKGEIRKNVYQKAIGSCNRTKEEICTKKRKSIFVIKEKKREDTSIYRRPAVKGIYLAIKIAIDLTSSFCSKKEQ